MQGLTIAPRRLIPEADVRYVLYRSSAMNLRVGLELAMSDGTVADVSEAMLPYTGNASIAHDNTAADIHSVLTTDLEPARAILPDFTVWTPTWGRDLVTPYMVLNAGSQDVRFNLGQYVLTSPGRDDDTTGLYHVTGYDKGYLFTGDVGDSYSVLAGTDVGLAIGQLVTALTGAPLESAESTGSTFATDQVWPLTDGTVFTWRQILADMCKAGSYAPIVPDQDGNLRLRALQPFATRPSEFLFAVGDTDSTLAAGLTRNDWIVGQRTMALDTWNVPNDWKFIQTNLTYQPVLGGGYATRENLTEGPTSKQTLGRTVRSVQWLDAASQDDLETQADAIKAQTIAQTETWRIGTGPLPIAGQDDIVTLCNPDLDPEERRLHVLDWTLPLNGDDMTWNLERLP